MIRFFTKTIFILFSAMLLTQLSARSQKFTGIDIKEQFVRDWERAKTYTLEYLNTMPPDKYSFKAVDSIRSFAQQMLHLATDNVGFIEYASGAKAGFAAGDLEKRTTAQNKDSVVYYVTQSYDFAIQSIKDFDPEKFGELVGSPDRQLTRFAVFLKGFEHQTHHRGQTTIYIRLVGIRPPNERLN
jgi:uncharacterized damage-inducible protein DinB